MPEFCTCGAQLPPDARFCHKCGKPQRDEPVVVEEEPVAAAPPPIPVLPVEAPISLRNRNAVRVSLFAGIFAFVFSALMGPAGLIAFVAAGFLAVFMYRRMTGQHVSMMNGARLGWITGIFVFVAALLTFTLGLATQPDLLEELRQRLVESSALSESEINQAMEIIRSPLGVALMLLGMFLSSTLLPAFGGALGAKLLDRGGSSAHHPNA